jgi:hypothetical protein
MKGSAAGAKPSWASCQSANGMTAMEDAMVAHQRKTI